ncbi:MAG: hypothetical protein JWN33_152 [Candidatus Saccharibacteria bacterium]|nr:hypothetical protein [Candidatus Saccharibacteria bacterium]
MLLLGSRILDKAVMSLQTGTRLASIKAPLIDPANLKIVAYVLEGPLLSEQPSFLRTADVRELSSIGLIVDSSDEFVGMNDVIKLEELYNLGFSLIGMPVIDEMKRKIGKVEDYTIETESFVIQQLHIKRGILRGFTDTGALIHRSQIVEINDKNIIVHTTAKKLTPVMKNERTTAYINPFRSTAPQPEQIKR